MLQIILGIILGLLIYRIIKKGHYWQEKGITSAKPSWPLVGNFGQVFLRKKHILEVVDDIYKEFSKSRYVGYFQFSTPALLIRDLDLIKEIGVKQFESFHDHRHFGGRDFDPLLTKTLIRLQGKDWKQMRATLSPAFTSSKMKTMYHLMVECAENFTRHFSSQATTSVDMKEQLSRFASDVIASAAFGIQVNSLEDPTNEFYTKGSNVLKFDFRRIVDVFVAQVAPKLAKVLKLKRLAQDVADFFTSVVMDNMRRRVKEGIVRPDLIQLLMEAQRGGLKHDSLEEKQEGFAVVEESEIGRNNNQMVLTDEHIIAQALLFFFAGFETVSNTAGWMAHELATHPDIQSKLQKEIDEVRETFQEKVPYDVLLSMKYLDQVVSETLRMWPPAFQSDRCCNKSYKLEPKSPNESTFVIEKGMLVVIPIIGLHRDPRYFPHPDRFDPERFNEENKSKIVPGSYLPFGIGPRNCIGSRFALLELKTLFFHLLAKYDIETNEKTTIPLRISKEKINISPENGFQLTLKLRTGR